jgi:hypothetical protein
MRIIDQIFGVGKDLTTLQMMSRTLIVFLLAGILIRLAGRRSFGLHAPLDNIITIMLGAVLSRAIVGASPFLPVIASSACWCCSIVYSHMYRFTIPAFPNSHREKNNSCIKMENLSIGIWIRHWYAKKTFWKRFVKKR